MTTFKKKPEINEDNIIKATLVESAVTTSEQKCSKSQTHILTVDRLMHCTYRDQ